MLLVDLPNELLSGVILRTMSDDFESFALSCKLIYTLSKETIPKHNAFKRRFASVSTKLESNNSYSLFKHPIDLLYDIWREPSIAQYVKCASFSQWNEANDDLTIKIQKFDGGIDFIQNSPFLRKSMVSSQPRARDQRGVPYQPQDLKKWHAAMYASADDPGPVVTLLLTLLPNLKTLYLFDTWSYRNEFLNPVMDVIAHGSPLEPHPLSNLNTIFLYHADDGTGTPLQTLAPFLTLPSLRRVVGYQLEADDSYHSYHWPYTSSSSTIDSIELTNSAISADGIPRFLRPLPNLRSLRYSHRGMGGGAGFLWNGGGFTKAVADTSGRQLEMLSVTISGGFKSMTGIGSMRGLQKLEWLELSAVLLLGEADKGEGDRALFDECNWDAPSAQQAAEFEVRMPLIELLPSSLSELRLLLGTSFDPEKQWDKLQNVFDGFAKGKAENLPHLRRVTLVHPGNKDLSEMTRELRDAAVEVVVCVEETPAALHSWSGE